MNICIFFVLFDSPRLLYMMRLVLCYLIKEVRTKISIFVNTFLSLFIEWILIFILILIDVSMSIQSTYSSKLTANSHIYSRTGCGLSNYYYEAIEIYVSETGDYSITINSTFNTCGYIYNNSFDVFNLTKNLIVEDDNSGYEKQFEFVKTLQINIIYILIVTTYVPRNLGNFSLLIIGSKHVSFNRISK